MVIESNYVVHFHVDYEHNIPIYVTAPNVDTAIDRAVRVLNRLDNQQSFKYGEEPWYAFEHQLEDSYNSEVKYSGIRTTYPVWKKNNHYVLGDSRGPENLYYHIDSVVKNDNMKIRNYALKQERYELPCCIKCGGWLRATDMKYNGVDEDGHYFEVYKCPHNKDDPQTVIQYDGPDDKGGWEYQSYSRKPKTKGLLGRMRR